jgi:hypothetical protein
VSTHEDELMRLARAVPDWRVSVDVNAKNGKFRIHLWCRRQKIVGLWRETLNEAIEAAIWKITEHEGIMADFPELEALREAMS